MPDKQQNSGLIMLSYMQLEVCFGANGKTLCVAKCVIHPYLLPVSMCSSAILLSHCFSRSSSWVQIVFIDRSRSQGVPF